MTGSAYFPREEYLAMDTLSELISIFIRKIFPLRIIISERNHPYSEEPSSRDYFLRIKSSPYERARLQGLFSRGEFISVQKNPSPGMLWEYKSIRHGRKSKLKMHGNRKQLPVSAKRPKAISGCMSTGNSIQKAAIAADEITNKVPRTPVSSIFIRTRRSARFSFVICPL